MRQFIQHILLFVLIMLVVAIAADNIVSYQLRHDHDRMYSGWTDLYTDSTNYDLVINGSSRGWVHYNPMILDSVLGVNSYNFGMDGSGLERQMIRYKTYCRYHKPPKYLVQNIDHVAMKYVRGYEREQYYPYFFYDWTLIRDINKTEQFDILTRWCPFYRYLGISHRKKDGPINKGFGGRNTQWDGTELAKVDTVKYERNQDLIHEFIDFLDEVTKSGTKVIFVYAPMYQGGIDKFYDIECMYQMYDTIANRFAIPILNYYSCEISQDTCYFYNATHMNAKGARRFSIKLADDLKCFFE